MKPLSAFFAVGIALASCSAFNKDDLNQSALKKYYDPPTIKISPDPSDPIIDVRANISIDVQHLGGLDSIIYKSDSGIKTYNAASSPFFNIKDTIGSSVSRTFPMTVTAYSMKTGISSTTNIEFLLFSGSVSGPPLITISEPALGRLLAPGAVSIRGSALHPVANIKNLIIQRAGYTPISYGVPTPNPPRYDFTQTANVAAGDTLDMTITAISGTGITNTTNMVWQVVDIPDIVSIDPPIAGTVINTTLTNFSVVVRSPHTNTTVSLFWQGSLKGSLTTDGSGTPLIFSNVLLPALSLSPPIGNVTLRIEASFPSGRTASQNYLFDVDHTLALVPPSITLLNPNPAVPLRSPSFVFETRIEQLYSGMKSINLTHVTPPTTSRVSNIPAVPFTTNIYFFENFPLSPYAGLHNYRLTSVSHANVTNISNFTYTLAGSTHLITPSSNSSTWQSFNFSVTNDTNISYVLISTNSGGNTAWRNIAAYVPNTNTYNGHRLIPVPFNSTMGVRLTSYDTNGVIVTNALSSTFVSHTSAFISSVFPLPSTRVPRTGGFPFVATVLSPVPISQVEIRVNGNSIFTQSGIVSGGNSYTFDIDISSHLVLGNNQVNVIVNGNPVLGSPVEYISVVDGGGSIFTSYPQDGSVVTAATARISIRNWDGSIQLLGGQVSITNLSTGEVQVIPSTINPGASYVQPSGQAFNLNMGENRFKIFFTGSVIKDDEIVIYRHNNTNY